MFKIIIVSDQTDRWKKIRKECQDHHFVFHLISRDELENQLEGGAIDLLIVDLEDIQGVINQISSSPAKGTSLLRVVASNQIREFHPNKQIDDLIFLPLNTDELICRIRQIIWKTQNIDPEQLLTAPGLTLDPNKYEVRLDDALINLTYKEYELLKFLMSNRGRVITREILLNKVWGYDYFGGTRTVDVHIRRLRSKIEYLPNMYIETIRNIGYRFKE